MEERSHLSSLLTFVLQWGNHFCCCIFPPQKLNRISWKSAHTGELVLRQARIEPQGRHREADADISSKTNLLWPLRDHLSSSSTLSPQDPFELYTSVSQMLPQTQVPLPAVACHGADLMFSPVSQPGYDGHTSICPRGRTTVSGHRWASPFPEHIWWNAAGGDMAHIPQTPAVSVWAIIAHMLAAASCESQLILISFGEDMSVSWEQKAQKSSCSVTTHILSLGKTVPSLCYPLALLVSLRVWDKLTIKQQGEVSLCPGPCSWHRQMCPGCTIPLHAVLSCHKVSSRFPACKGTLVPFGMVRTDALGSLQAALAIGFFFLAGHIAP